MRTKRSEKKGTANFVMRNRDLLFKHGEKFQETFARSLHSYWSPLFGFDIVKFDQWLEVPDGMSTKNFVRKKYGKKAMELVKGLL